MAQPAPSALNPEYRSSFTETPAKNEAYSSSVSWTAVIAGAFVAAALSLVLLALGSGIGLSSVSPWSNAGASASAVSTGAILWMIVMQIVSFSMGGYLGGRLRTKWVNVHTNEVYFSDTAHGFLVWAVGVVITAAFLASAAVSMVGGTGTSGMATDNASPRVSLNEYFVDSLFRADHPTTTLNDSLVREAGIIVTSGVRHNGLPAADKSYLAQLVAAQTGLSEPEAENRVSQVFDQARQDADAARKAVAHSLYWLFLALLIGAFCASYAATIGGRQRDHLFVV